MISLNWPIVISTTIVLYVLIILTLPFNTIYATLLLFTLIGFWSRLPGVGIVHPGLFLYMADIIDVFTIIVAINLGGTAGAMFVIFGNLWSRLCGIFPPWSGVIKETIILSLVSFIVPALHSILNGNLVLVAIWFTIFREVGFLILSLAYPTTSWPEYIFNEAIILTSLIVVNSIYMKFFGTFFDDLMGKGVTFSWPLFFFATIVILIVSMTMFGFSPKQTGKKIGKNVKKIVKSRVRQIKRNSNKTEINNDLEEMDKMKRIKEDI